MHILSDSDLKGHSLIFFKLFHKAFKFIVFTRIQLSSLVVCIYVLLVSAVL
jgi:hypothetical protein